MASVEGFRLSDFLSETKRYAFPERDKSKAIESQITVNSNGCPLGQLTLFEQLNPSGAR